MLIQLPSGEDWNRSVRMVRPAEGATASLSTASIIAFCAAAAARPASLFSSVSNSSRLATSPRCGPSGMAPNMALMRGSIRGSSTSLDAIARFLLVLGNVVGAGGVGAQAFSREMGRSP